MKPSILLAFLSAALLVTSYARAQTAWKPEKNVEIVVALTPGSSQDRSARFLQNLWTSKGYLTVPVTINNRVGGNGNIAWNYLATHGGDAHWFQISSPTILTNHILGSASFTHVDYTPLALLGNQYIGVAVRIDSALKSVREMVEILRANPAALSMGTNSQGSYLHIVCAQIARTAGMDPRKLKLAIFQGGELMTAALGGHVEVWAGTVGNALPLVQEGRIRVLGISAPQRQPGAFAAVPTFREQGVDAVYSAWRGFLAAKGLTAAQTGYWDRVFSRMVDDPDWKEELEKNAWGRDFQGAAETRKFLEAEHVLLEKMMADLGIIKR